MNTLTKPPMILKVLWFIPFALLLAMAGMVEAMDGISARPALVTLAVAALFFLVAAAARTILWLGREPLPQRT
jgi:hypothetical protein